MDEGIPEGGITVTRPAWDAWGPGEVAGRLAGTDARWYVVGGWALDLFLGEPTRPHEDLEIGVAAGDFDAVRAALGDHEFDVVGSGRRWPLNSPAFARTYQTWVRDPASGVYRLDVFREPHDCDTWIFRRDETLRLPYSRVLLRTPQGVPYLTPEIVLLFKAKEPRPKDHADLDVVLPTLGPVRRAWLRRALARRYPGHPWLALL
jgi:hypothetical protein